MGKLLDILIEYRLLSTDVRIKRKAKIAAEEAISKYMDVVEWKKETVACRCFYRNINMPMSARAFMRVPLEKDCDNFKPDAVCDAGKITQCKFVHANEVYITAKSEYDIACTQRKQFVQSVFNFKRK